jgi:predicted nuclease with TOPRIM domain
MIEENQEKIKSIKTFLSQNEMINLDNLSWVINKLQDRITDLENEVFLKKNERT